MKNAMTPARLLIFVIGFGVARGGLFAAPILLANILPLGTYGQIEAAQAVAGIAALLIGFGLPGTVPLILIRKETAARWDTLLLLVGLVSAALFLLALSQMAGRGPALSLPVLVPLATAVLLLQGFWATALKSHSKSTMAVFLEAGFWLAVLLGGVALYQFGSGTGWIIGALVVYAMAMLGVTLWQYLGQRLPFTLVDLVNNLKLGAPLMLTSLLTLLLISFGRVALGQAAGAEIVGVYAVIFRATALPLVAHQILIIGFFRQLFSWDLADLQRRSPLIIWGVGVSILAFWVLVQPLGWMLGQRFVGIFAQYEFEGKVILLQTVLWSAIALNDLLNSRGEIAGQVARWTGPYLLFGLPMVYLWLRTMPDTAALLGLFIPVYGAFMVGFYVVQCGAMARHGNVYYKLWGSTAAIVILGMAGLALLEG